MTPSGHPHDELQTHVLAPSPATGEASRSVRVTRTRCPRSAACTRLPLQHTQKDLRPRRQHAHTPTGTAFPSTIPTEPRPPPVTLQQQRRGNPHGAPAQQRPRAITSHARTSRPSRRGTIFLTAAAAPATRPQPPLRRPCAAPTGQNQTAHEPRQQQDRATRPLRLLFRQDRSAITSYARKHPTR
jgi:hypothetical protein